MAKQRYVNTKLWSDSWISDLDPIEKLLFIYLITNERTNICGVYELPIKYMSIETGIEKAMIEKVIKRFQKDKKVFYYDGWVYIKNFQKHQDNGNEKIKKGIEMCINLIPQQIKDKIYAMDRVSIPNIYPPNYSNSNINTNSNNNSNTVEQINLQEFFNKQITIPETEHKTLLLEEKKKFIDYWTEMSPNGKKERWQMEKVFDIKRRWGRWIKNVEARMKPKEFKKVIEKREGGGANIGELLTKYKK